MGHFLPALALLAVAAPLGAIDSHRGDVNSDGRLDLSDVVQMFRVLAQNEDPTFCPDLGDVNSDGQFDYSDAVTLSRYLFSQNVAIAPLPEGNDPFPCRQARLAWRNLHTTVLSPVSAMIAWETATREGTRVSYGLNSDRLDKVATIEELALYHAVLLDKLKPGTKYYYQVTFRSDGDENSTSGVKSFNTLETLEANIQNERPRIFITSKDIPRLRDETIGPRATKADLWKTLSEWCDVKLNATSQSLAESENADLHAEAFALAALISGKDAYREKAFDIVEAVTKGHLPSEPRAQVEAMAVVYDWLHDDLPQGLQKKLLREILRGLDVLNEQVKDNEFVVGHSQGNHKSLFIGAVAVYGEDRKGAELVDEVLQSFRYGFLATWRRFSGADGGSSKGWWYTTFALPFAMEFFHTLRSSTGTDLFASERSWCEGLLDWYLFGLRGDNTFLREGDGVVFNGLNFQDRFFGRLLASEYGNSRAQWFAKLASVETPIWGAYTVFDILWSDPEVKPIAPTGPTSRHFRDVGEVIVRESWKREAAIASFRCAEVYTLGHTHLDNCSFSLYYKGALALDSGVYDAFNSKHHRNYYTRTIAHNTVTVYDPKEKFFLLGTEYANDGGQMWFVDSIDGDRKHWPATAEETVDPDAGYRLGGMPRYEDTDEYTYAMGKGAPAYNPRKLKRFNRHFLWLKDVAGWPHPVIVVFDDVISTSPTFEKKYLLHTSGKPSIDGALVSASANQGQLYQWTLAPDDAKITAVGGPGKEFLVEGLNYAPERAPRDNEDAGAWRIEVSPGEGRNSDRFVHALYATDAGKKAPAPGASFAVDAMQVCEVAQWTILFDTASLPDKFEYDNRREGTKHIVFGAAPNESYAVYLDGEEQEEAVASFSGTLRFDLADSGKVRIVRRKE